jgi:hypothetical protein
MSAEIIHGGYQMDERIAAIVREQAKEGTLGCAEAFRIAEELGAAPLAVGEAADGVGVRLVRCQLGLFGYGEQKRIVKPVESVSPDLERAIREGLAEGRLPCATAWAIAARLGLPKMGVSNAAEKLGIRIKPCQLGAF